MFIHEAIAARSKACPYIQRASWRWYPTENIHGRFCILPTDTPDGCVIISPSRKDRCPGWQPTAADLTANDWEVTKC